MQEKEMINDYLEGLNASLAAYGSIIAQCNNVQLRQTIQDMRNKDEERQYNLYKAAYAKKYYIPADPADPSEVEKVKQQLSQG